MNDDKEMEIKFAEFRKQSVEIIEHFSDFLRERKDQPSAVCHALSWMLGCVAQEKGLEDALVIEGLRRSLKGVARQSKDKQQ